MSTGDISTESAWEPPAPWWGRDRLIRCIRESHRYGNELTGQMAAEALYECGYKDGTRHMADKFLAEDRQRGLALADDDSEAQAEAAEQRARFLGPVGPPDIDARSRDLS